MVKLKSNDLFLLLLRIWILEICSSFPTLSFFSAGGQNVNVITSFSNFLETSSNLLNPPSPSFSSFSYSPLLSTSNLPSPTPLDTGDYKLHHQIKICPP
jgi:hypothetical protein